MPRLPATLLFAVLLSLACGGDVTPKYPREEIAFSKYDPPEMFEGMDLPYYGGRIARASERSITVSYNDDLATAEQLREWWPESLQKAGFQVDSPSVSGNGAYTALLESPDGTTGTLTIRPEGTLWWVIISL